MSSIAATALFTAASLLVHIGGSSNEFRDLASKILERIRAMRLPYQTSGSETKTLETAAGRQVRALCRYGDIDGLGSTSQNRTRAEKAVTEGRLVSGRIGAAGKVEV